MLEVEKNEYAVTISRIIDYDDWGIDPAIFGILDIAWGPHIVDYFASLYNKKVDRFHSCFWSPGCEAVDTFTFRLGQRSELVGTTTAPSMSYHPPCIQLQCQRHFNGSCMDVSPILSYYSRWWASSIIYSLWWPVQFFLGLLVPGYGGGSLGDSLS